MQVGRVERQMASCERPNPPMIMLFPTLNELRRLRKRAAALEQQLIDERSRHLKREDELIDRLLHKQGLHSVPTPTVAPKKLEIVKPVETKLTAMEEATLVAFQEEAVRRGGTEEDGRKTFWALKLGQPMPELHLTEAEFEWQQ